MTIYLTRLKVGHPEPLKHPVDDLGSWKIYVICVNESPWSSTTLADVRACLDPKDKESMRSSFVSLLEKARTGFPLQSLYDEKQCHEAHTYTRKHDEIKILRIWGTGTIRIYFIYLPEKRIVILKTKPKRTDKLSTGDTKDLESIANSVLDCLEKYSFDKREIS